MNYSKQAGIKKFYRFVSFDKKNKLKKIAIQIRTKTTASNINFKIDFSKGLIPCHLVCMVLTTCNDCRE